MMQTFQTALKQYARKTKTLKSEKNQLIYLEFWYIIFT
jgi:hypothetical protein